ncbi:MAG: exo-alpha-sialidase [Bacteroidia bacterium]
MRYYTCFCLLFWSCVLISQPTYTDVFVSGQEGYHTYRIPSIVQTQKGTLLAFAEARVTQSDHAQNDLVLKRSYDQGQNWDSIQVIISAGEASLNNPQAVVLENGRVLLMYQKYPPEGGEHYVKTGYEGDDICWSYLTYSDNDGQNWSPPEEITRSVKRPTYVTSVASGPGVGIQLQNGAYKGRIIMPFNQGPFGHWMAYAAYSDDAGQSWAYGEVAFPLTEGLANEVQMVERKDGSIMLNARSMGTAKYRKIAISEDGGQNWSGLVNDSTLIESRCQASIIRHSFSPSIMVFANPATQEGRTNGTIRLSYDEGETWPIARTIYTDSFAYSCLVSLNTDSLGLLFEADNYGRIVFARFSLDWLQIDK